MGNMETPFNFSHEVSRDDKNLATLVTLAEIQQNLTVIARERHRVHALARNPTSGNPKTTQGNCSNIWFSKNEQEKIFWKEVQYQFQRKFHRARKELWSVSKKTGLRSEEDGPVFGLKRENRKAHNKD